MDKRLKQMEKKVERANMDPTERKKRGKEIHAKQMARHQQKVHHLRVCWWVQEAVAWHAVPDTLHQPLDIP